MTRLTRRAAAVGVLALLPLSGAAAVARRPAKPAPAPVEDGMVMGSAKAKVTVIEYASLSCPHCARWANDVFPAFKAKFIDTGKVRYVLREFITEPAEVAAAGWLTARCAAPAKYFDVVAAIFRDQAKLYETGDLRGVLLPIAKSAGLSEAQFDKCLTDQAALAALNQRVERYATQEKVNSTPTFVVNGRKLEGEHTLEALSAAIAQAGRGR